MQVEAGQVYGHRLVIAAGEGMVMWVSTYTTDEAFFLEHSGPLRQRPTTRVGTERLPAGDGVSVARPR